jgi:TolB-like protein/DNA-binding winged helix-turn-helix (wHTH) protein
MQRETKQILEFGPFRMHIAEKLLVRDGETLPLAPKTFDLLLALVEHQGQVLDKDTLMRLVWPDSFVEEGNLSKGVFLLRQILGDGYIETLPKRGYRFLEEVHATGNNATVIQQQSPVTIRKTRRRYWPIALGLGALALIALTAVLLFPARGERKIRSVVVLPFVNLGSSPEDDYFSDGLTEELINMLAGIEGLRVVARTSAFQFKGKSADVRDIGRTLHVDGVIEGSVRRDQSRMRITVQLNSAHDGYHFWSKTFDRENAGVFAVQDEIAQAVASTVARENGAQPAKRTARSGTRNVEAYNLYLKGEYVRQRVGPFTDQAFTLFQKATALDPSFAAAWTGLAIAYQQWGYSYSKYPRDVYPQAIAALRHALALDPKLALSHALMGKIQLVYNRDWASAKRELDIAVALDPDDGETHHWLSQYWVSIGDFKLAQEESLRAQSCDPLNAVIAANQVFELEEAARYPEAVAAAQQALQLFPAHRGTLYFMQVAYERWGKIQDAIAARRRAGFNYPSPDALERALAEKGPAGYWRLRADAEEALHRRKIPIPPVSIARSYAFLGETDRALDWLSQGIEERDGYIVYMKHEPTFAAMRNNPRFIALVKAAGIP